MIKIINTFGHIKFIYIFSYNNPNYQFINIFKLDTINSKFHLTLKVLIYIYV